MLITFIFCISKRILPLDFKKSVTLKCSNYKAFDSFFFLNKGIFKQKSNKKSVYLLPYFYKFKKFSKINTFRDFQTRRVTDFFWKNSWNLKILEYNRKQQLWFFSCYTVPIRNWYAEIAKRSLSTFFTKPSGCYTVPIRNWYKNFLHSFGEKGTLTSYTVPIRNWYLYCPVIQD